MAAILPLGVAVAAVATDPAIPEGLREVVTGTLPEMLGAVAATVLWFLAVRRPPRSLWAAAGTLILAVSAALAFHKAAGLWSAAQQAATTSGTWQFITDVRVTDAVSEPETSLLAHLRFGDYLADRGADAILRLDEMNPGPYPKVDLGDPVQMTGTAGSVLFAHYLLAHNIGHHDGAERRERLYFRLRAEGHRDRWRDVVTNPLMELRS